MLVTLIVTDVGSNTDLCGYRDKRHALSPWNAPSSGKTDKQAVRAQREEPGVWELTGRAPQFTHGSGMGRQGTLSRRKSVQEGGPGVTKQEMLEEWFS